MKQRAGGAQMLLRRAALVAVCGVGACTGAEPVLPPDTDRLAIGTWGGDNVAVIVSDSTVHVHIGCTNGTFVAPLLLDEQGRFTTRGMYVLRAYPVQVGPPQPAQLAGIVRGGVVTISVAVADTVPVALGPVDAVYAREPRMAVCPVCATAPRSLAR